MLSLPRSVRNYLCAEPVDMRKSFDGLSTLVMDVLGEDLLSARLLILRPARRVMGDLAPPFGGALSRSKQVAEW